MAEQMMNKDHADEFVSTLRDAGYEPESYSGRRMYGKTCLSISLASVSELFSLGIEVGACAQSFPGLQDPALDQMGKHGWVAYWPNIPAPAEEEEDT